MTNQITGRSGPSHPAREGAVVAGQLRVLLVEDNTSDARLVEELLRDAADRPIAVTHVSTLRQALHELTNHGFDAVLLDLALPDSQGMETFRRTRDIARESPIVVLTGFADENFALEAVHEGAQDYLVKGRVDGPALLNALRYAVERCQLQQRLNESEAQCRLVTEAASDTIVTIGADGVVRFVNASVTRMFGYTPEEVVGQPLTMLMAEHSRARHEAALGKYIATGVRSTQWPGYQRLARRRNGDEFPVEVSVGSAVGNGHLFVGIVRDITEQKRMHDALAMSEARHRELWDGAPVGLYQSTPDGTLVDVNPELVRLLRYPDREALLGANSMLLYVDPQQRNLWKSELEDRGTSVGRESQLVRFDGTPIWVEEHSHVVRDLPGRITGYRGGVVDIGERKRMEAALRASEARYRSVVEGVLQGVVVHQGGRIVFANAAMAGFAGFESAEQLVGREVWEFVATEDRERLAAFQRARELGQPAPHRYEFQAQRTDGTRGWLDCSVSTVEWDGIPAIMATLVDITQQRVLLQQFVQAQKMEAVGRLAGGVAHDFNNLLTVILGFVTFAEEDSPPGDRRASDLREVRRAAELATGLTRQLLAFSRRQVLQTEVLSLSAVVEGVEKMLRRLIGEDIEIRTALAKDLSSVRADRGQLEQAIMNLAVNARDAMPRGGQLTIKTANVNLTEAHAAANGPVRPGRYVMLSVSDTGVGMDETTRGQLFEPFFTTKEQGKGTGLGLATVFGITNQSDGYISVDTAPGRGTTFSLYLPAVPELPQSIPNGRDDQAPCGHETILVLDDDSGVRTVAARSLELCGYTVLQAQYPEAALALCREHGSMIALLLTDVVMPGMTGPDAAEEARRIIPGIRVLYMSGYPDRVSNDAVALAAGVPFLQKPFTPARLAQMVREALKG